jgi:hypothetical protein
VFEFNGTAYMVMRFEEGDNLASLLDRRGTLPERDLLRILLPILDGLELVHNAGFIHRDIKPDNIHIRSDGSPVLLDFGSARHALGKAHTLTILVAPGYAPFEQYHSSSENQGPWTDIYGLGATCYRAIAGTQPMDAITRSKGILGSTREVLVPARTVGSGRYSAHLLAAVDHALEFAEKNRPQNVAEWRREILGESSAAGAAPAVPDKSAVAASQWASPPASTPAAGPSAPPAVPPQAAIAAHGTPPRADVPTARRGWSGARAPIAWSIAGAAAAAIAIGVFLWPPVDRDPEEKIRQIQKELDRTKELLKESETDAKTRQKLLALLAEQEEAKRRQEEEARKRREEQARQAEAKQRQEEVRKLRAEQERQAEAKRRQEEARIRREEEERLAEAKRLEEEQRLALLERSGSPSATRSPQAEQLARGEAALARGEYEKAIEILTPLAKDGNSRAQIRLAEMYAFGQGVKQNTIQSYIWYSLAAYGGNTSAAAGRDRMAARLQPAEIKQAERVVESMRPR